MYTRRLQRTDIQNLFGSLPKLNSHLGQNACVCVARLNSKLLARRLQRHWKGIWRRIWWQLLTWTCVTCYGYVLRGSTIRWVSGSGINNWFQDLPRKVRLRWEGSLALNATFPTSFRNAIRNSTTAAIIQFPWTKFHWIQWLVLQIPEIYTSTGAQSWHYFD